MIKNVLKKIHWEVSLFCEKIFYSTYFCIFHCILPVPTPQYTIILLLLPNIMPRCCWYTCTEHLTSRYVKKIHWVFLVYWISFIFLPIFGIFSMYSSRFEPAIHCLTHDTHLFLSHWTCNHTLLASNDFIFCMSCYYNFHLNILLGSDFGVLSHLWSQNNMIMSWLRLTTISNSNCFPLPS